MPTIILDFFGVIISAKLDSNLNFLWIFKALRVLYDKWLAIYTSVPPAEDSVRVCSKE